MRYLLGLMCVLLLVGITGGCKDVGDACGVDGTKSCDPLHVLVCGSDGVWLETGSVRLRRV